MLTTRPTSPLSFSQPVATVKRGLSKLMTRRPESARPFTPTLQTLFPGYGKTKGASASAATDQGHSQNEPAALHHSASAGNMLELHRQPSSVSPRSQPLALPRPKSVNALDRFATATTAEALCLQWQREQIQWDIESIEKLPLAKLAVQRGRIEPSERYRRVQKLRLHCKSPELRALVDWEDLTRSCWKEVDHSFGDIFKKRTTLDAGAFSQLLRQLANVAHLSGEVLAIEDLSSALFEGMLPTLQRLHKRGSSDEFHFLIEQLQFAKASQAFRSRKSSKRVEVCASESRTTWQVDPSDSSDEAELFLRPFAR